MPMQKDMQTAVREEYLIKNQKIQEGKAMYCKKCGKKILELLVICLMAFIFAPFSCERVYAEDTIEEIEPVERTEETFDASAYLKALLDNSYKNDSSLIVLMGIATAEEAAEIYEKGLDTEVDGMDYLGLSAEENAEYRKLFADLLAGAKYTVGEAEKQDDGSYVVTVAYEKMKVFEPAMEAYMYAVYAYIDILVAAQEIPSDAELTEWLAMTFKYCIEESLKSASYGEPQTTTVRISLEDNEWTPGSSDLINLEEVFFDIDDARMALF